MPDHEIVQVPFHGGHIVALKQADGHVFVAMKPLVENGMGMDWPGQCRKMRRHHILRTCMVNITIQVPWDTQEREQTFLPLNKLPFFLATLQPNRIPDTKIRKLVTEHQKESVDVLFGHFYRKAAGLGGEDATLAAEFGRTD
jgi:hypothetical protein